MDSGGGVVSRGEAGEVSENEVIAEKASAVDKANTTINTMTDTMSSVITNTKTTTTINTTTNTKTTTTINTTTNTKTTTTTTHTTPTTLHKTIGTLSLALHFTYLVTPSFSFSSLRWASAFILTHSTRVIPQCYSMVLSVFFAYYLLPQVLPLPWAREVLRLQVLVVIVSTLYNTASPVIWSVFTPLLLFVLVMESVYTLSSLSTLNRSSPSRRISTHTPVVQ